MRQKFQEIMRRLERDNPNADADELRFLFECELGADDQLFDDWMALILAEPTEYKQ